MEKKKLGPFNKTSDFWWQHEFRLVFKEMNPNLNAMIMEIGDISDIAYCVKTKVLRPLIEAEKVGLLLPDKSNSPNQKYYKK